MARRLMPAKTTEPSIALSVPVSKGCVAGRTLYVRHCDARSARTVASPRCGPKYLYGEQRRTSASSSPTSIGACGAKCTASTHASAPAACASSAMRRRRSASDGVRRERCTRRRVCGRSASARDRRSRASCRRRSRRTRPQAEVVRELEPGGDVAVMVELRDEDLVALAQRAAEGARQREVEGRHVGAEDRLVGIAAQECRRGEACLRDQRVAAAARCRMRRRGSRSTRAGSGRSRR